MSGKKNGRVDKNNNGAGENLPLIPALNIKDDKYTLTVTVRKASVGDGLKRGHLIGRSFEKADSVDRAAAALHANCICCSEGEIKNLKTPNVAWYVQDLPITEFLNMNEAMVELWLEKIFEFNPRWVPDFTSIVDQKKT